MTRRPRGPSRSACAAVRPTSVVATTACVKLAGMKDGRMPSFFAAPSTEP